jgi:predicted metalloprotease with PDZ domain
MAVSLRIAPILLVLLVSTTIPAADAPVIEIEVDGRDLPRRLLHTTMKVPCKPGKLRLWYPKWLPGTHGPWGRVEDIGGLKIETDQGKPLEWKRDEVDFHCVVCEVPEGAVSVQVRLDTICNQSNFEAAGMFSYGNKSLGIFKWNTCLLYPEGHSVRDLRARLKVILPWSWKFATALKVDERKDNRIGFEPVSLEELVDSPLIAGEHLRSFKLDVGKNPPVYLDVVSESPRVVDLPKEVVDLYSTVVREACALFGTAHYPEYHFLVTCSDQLGYLGLEHHCCSINGVKERDLIDNDKRRGWIANLLPHEYAHSWCGKFRRPKDMCTSDFHSPQKTKLLWVYEGLTQYIGDLLMVRSGLIKPAEYVEMLSWTLGGEVLRPGRKWRPLEDTAVASAQLRGISANWSDLRRDQDYYMEGMLLWLEVDLLIRDLSKGKYSLDDFCKRFMGPTTSKEKVIPYDLEEIVGILKELADHDWQKFFARRVALPLETLPLDVVGMAGYKIGHSAKSSSYIEYLQSSRYQDFICARDSLGLQIGPDGTITVVVSGSIGDKAGFVVGNQILGVNNKKFSRDHFNNALNDSTTLKRLDFIVVENDNIRIVPVNYAGGPRFFELSRDMRKKDMLAEIFKAKSGN